MEPDHLTICGNGGDICVEFYKRAFVTPSACCIAGVPFVCAGARGHVACRRSSVPTRRNFFTGGGITMHHSEHETRGLQRLSDTRDFQVAPDQPDVRGWSVVGGNGEVIGKVDDLLVDPGRMKVVELDVDVKGADHITVPAADAEVDRTRREVRIRGYASGTYGRGADAVGTDRHVAADRDA